VGEVIDIVDFGREDGVVFRAECGGEISEDEGDGVFGADAIGLDHFADRSDEGLILEHATVEEEDLGGFLAHFLFGLGVERLEIVDTFLDGGIEAGEFIFDEGGGDDAFGDAAGIGGEEMDARDDDTGRNIEPFEHDRVGFSRFNERTDRWFAWHEAS